MKLSKLQLDHIKERFNKKFEVKCAQWEKDNKVENPNSYENKYNILKKFESLPLKDWGSFHPYDVKDVINCLDIPEYTKEYDKQWDVYEKYKKERDEFIRAENTEVNAILDDIILGNEEFTEVFNKY